MIPTNPYVLAVILGAALLVWTVETVKAPVAHAARKTCHTITLGHKCAPPVAHTP